MSDTIPVGICPDHGKVVGDQVDLNFPNEPTCECGATLERAGVLPRAEVNLDAR